MQAKPMTFCRLDSHWGRSVHEFGSNLPGEDQEEFSRLASIAQEAKAKYSAEDIAHQHSPLFQRTDWKRFVNVLYPSDSPYIALGNNFHFRRRNDFWGTQDTIYYQCAGCPMQEVIKAAHTDDGGVVNALDFGWLHRQDITAGSIGKIVADAYSMIHTQMLQNNTRFFDKYQRKPIPLQISVTYENQEHTNIPLEDYDPSLFTSGNNGVLDHIDFFGSCFQLQIGGSPGFYNVCSSWKPDHAFITVNTPASYASDPTLRRHIYELFQKTSIFAQHSLPSQALQKLLP